MSVMGVAFAWAGLRRRRRGWWLVVLACPCFAIGVVGFWCAWHAANVNYGRGP
jgi:hypothetical protein